MASLTGQTISASYEQILHVDRSGGGNTSTLVNIKDGDNGTTFCASMTDASTGKAILSIDGSHANGTALYIDNSAADGDVSLEFQLGGTTTWLIGIEDGDSDSLKICHDSTMGSDERLSFLTASTVFNEDSGDIDFRIEGNGNANIFFVDAGQDRIGIGTSAPAELLNVVETDNADTVVISNSHASFSNATVTVEATRSANSGYTFFYATASGTSDAQFKVDGAGVVHAENQTITELDYAEYFESTDGKAIPLGTTVILENGKVRASKEGESPFGVVSSTLANGSAWNRWYYKYLRDDYNAYVWEDDPDVDRDALEEGDDGKRRVINPDYDESLEYIPRDKRDEWNSIGLLGQVPITKGQPVASNWIKMSEISDKADMWFIK